MGYSEKVCRQPKRPMTSAGDRNCFHCHQSGNFKRNFPMLALKFGNGVDPLPSTTACKKMEYTKTREAYTELVIAGRTCSAELVIAGRTCSDVTLFPHALVCGLPLDQCVVDLSAAIAPFRYLVQ